MSSEPSIQRLSPQARDLAERTLAWCDQWWDEDAQLPRSPDGAGFTGPGVPEGPLHLVPQAGWYAFGLLLRDAGNGRDRERSVRVLETLLTLQYEAPGTIWDGTFCRFAESPRPPARGAVIWADYDPNWRQFLGTTFLLILRSFEARLPASLVAGLDGALRRAVEGEPPHRVPASYANIALMKAFLEVEAGARLGEPGWIHSGEALAREIVARFDAHGAFDEFNSPTYYGMDLFALALWSRATGSALLASEGPRLSAALWRSLADWYHPGLRNLCGPYTRSYGMDLGSYVAQLSLFLWRELGAEHAPLPPLDAQAEHGHDLFLGPVVALLGSPIPDDVRPRFVSFTGAHAVRQTICREPIREATGWLGERFMAGAEHCGADLSWWDQYVAAALHWRRPDGGTGWLSVRAPGPVAARADRSGLTFQWEGNAAREADLRLHAAPPEAPNESGGLRLPGLVVSIEGTVLGMTPETHARSIRLRSVTRDGGSRIGLRVDPSSV